MTRICALKSKVTCPGRAVSLWPARAHCNLVFSLRMHHATCSLGPDFVGLRDRYHRIRHRGLAAHHCGRSGRFTSLRRLAGEPVRRRRGHRRTRADRHDRPHPRKQLLLGLMVLFTVGNLLAWMAPGYATLMGARVLTGLTHGVFFSIGSTIATSLVPKKKAASAIALMFSGLTVALVTGVPLGTWIGQHFGWQATFLSVALLGVAAVIGSAVLVPSNIAGSAPSSIATPLAVLKQPRLLLVYAMTTLGYGGTFIAFTYLASILQQVAGFSAGSVAW